MTWVLLNIANGEIHRPNIPDPHHVPARTPPPILSWGVQDKVKRAGVIKWLFWNCGKQENSLTWKSLEGLIWQCNILDANYKFDPLSTWWALIAKAQQDRRANNDYHHINQQPPPRKYSSVNSSQWVVKMTSPRRPAAIKNLQAHSP